MTAKQEIITRVRQIETLLAENNYENIGSYLAELETTDVTVELLQETEAVSAVYRALKSCPSANVKKKAKFLLSKWNTLYKKDYLDLKNSQEDISASKENENFAEEQAKTSHELSLHEVLKFTSASPSKTVHKEAIYKAPENDAKTVQGDSPESQSGLVKNEPSPQQKQDQLLALRTKCTELIYRALADSAACQRNVDEMTHDLAKRIEQHIFTTHARNEKRYKICIRSKVSNLKNPKNPNLSQRLFSGTLSPKAFVEMTALEMASDDLKRLRAAYTESSVLEHQLPRGVEGTPTNKIKCRRCENFDCTVTMIARGTLFLPGWVRNGKPDDEMMTFISCNVCGEKWFHNGWVCL